MVVSIEDRLSGSDSLADFCAKAQSVNLDAGGAYYGSRTCFGPLQLGADPRTWQVFAANHTTRTIGGASITARLYDLSGRQLNHIEQQGMNIESLSSAPAFVISWPTSPRPLHLLRMELHDNDGALLSQNVYWRYAAAQDPKGSTTLARTRLSVSVHDVKDDSLKATVANRGGAIAAMVRLTLQDRSGARLPTAGYEDDDFWLLPGESRELSISWPTGASLEHSPRVSVRAYNAATQAAH